MFDRSLKKCMKVSFGMLCTPRRFYPIVDEIHRILQQITPNNLKRQIHFQKELTNRFGGASPLVPKSLQLKFLGLSKPSKVYQ